MALDGLDRPRDNEKPLTPEQLKDIGTSLESALKDAELRKNILALFDSLDSSLKDKTSAQGGFKEIFGGYLEGQKNALSKITDPSERLKVQQATTKHLLDTTIWYADKKGDVSLRASAIDLINQYTTATEQVSTQTHQNTESLKADLNQFGEKYNGIRGLPEGTEARKWTVGYSDKTKREIIRIVDTKSGNILHTVPLSSDGGLMGDQDEHTYIINGTGYKITGKGGNFEMKSVPSKNPQKPAAAPKKEQKLAATPVKPQEPATTPNTVEKTGESNLDISAQNEFKRLNLTMEKGSNNKIKIIVPENKTLNASIDGGNTVLIGKGGKQLILDSTDKLTFDSNKGVFILTNIKGGTQMLKITEMEASREAPRKTEPIKKAPESLMLQGDIYDIGVQVFEKLRKPGESISFSPTSLQQVLYVYTLSHSNTELANKLGFTGSDKTQFEALLKTLNNKDAAPFKSVNAVFSKLGGFGNEKLLRDLKVELGKINPNDIPGETARLNKFVSDQTNGMIKGLFKASDMSSAQEIFVNTMYFKGDWESKFDEKRTMKDQQFGDKKADLMIQTGKFEGVKTKTSRAIKMPFSDGSSMIAFLPDNNLSDTIKEANQLLKGPNSIKFGEKSKIQLTFPKFETESMADGIGSTLGIDVDVIQKSKVIVNEKGAEAAAASGMISRGFSVDPELKFDKPFYYAIQDKTGNVHFMGTYEGK